MEEELHNSLRLALRSRYWPDRQWLSSNSATERADPRAGQSGPAAKSEFRASVGLCLGSHGKWQDFSSGWDRPLLREPALPDRGLRSPESRSQWSLSPGADSVQRHGNAATSSYPERSPAAYILQRNGWRRAHSQSSRHW